MCRGGLRDQPDVKTVPAETIGTERVSARAEDEFVAAFGAEERQQSLYRMFVEVHRVVLQKEPAGERRV
jgi:hypothetical protein